MNFRDDVRKQNLELGKLSISKKTYKNKSNLSKLSTITSMLQIAKLLQ